MGSVLGGHGTFRPVSGDRSAVAPGPRPAPWWIVAMVLTRGIEPRTY